MFQTGTYNVKSCLSLLDPLTYLILSFLDGNASSDFDEDSFMPSYNRGPNDTMPSLSQFDSMMEPLDDEFHAGLNFKNTTSMKTYSNQSRDHFEHSDDVMDTDDDVDDLPLENREETDFRKPKTGKLYPDIKKLDEYTNKNLESDDSPDAKEYEFLDQSELVDVTDEEINQQNFGGRNEGEKFNGKNKNDMLGF